jgi:hypothetical protein
MGSRAFEIFGNEDGREKWDKHVKHVDAVEELTGGEKDKVKEAFSYLRGPDVLGEGFITRARRSGHPLWSYFAGPVPWKLRWLTRFATAMRELRDAAGFQDHVREQMKDAGKFSERESVLEIAYKFFKAGFEVSFDPAVAVSKPRGLTGRRLSFQGAPDLKIVDKGTGEEIFVEVSALGTSDIARQCKRNHNLVWDILAERALFRESLFPRARVRRIIDDDELTELAEQLRELVAKVKSSGEVEYLENDMIEACVAPAHQKDVPDRWADERGIEDIPVEGPSIPLQDPFRIQRIIRKEQKQLPDGRPGIVVITTDWALLFHANGVGAVISEHETVLRDLPRLSCTVACCTYGGGEKEGYVASNEQHTAVKRVTESGLTEEAVISLNPSCAVPLSDGASDRVRDAFIRG